MLTPNSTPDRPAWAARAATAGSRAPPPQRMRGGVEIDRRQVAIELDDEPGHPIVGDQQVRARADHGDRQGRGACPRSSSPNCSSSPALANHSAAPPVRTVAKRASGTSRRTIVGGSGTAPSDRPPAARPPLAGPLFAKSFSFGCIGAFTLRPACQPARRCPRRPSPHRRPRRRAGRAGPARRRRNPAASRPACRLPRRPPPGRSAGR